MIWMCVISFAGSFYLNLDDLDNLDDWDYLDYLDDVDDLDNLDEDVLSTSFAGSLIWMSTLRLTSSSFDTEIPLTPSISHKFRG